MIIKINTSGIRPSDFYIEGILVDIVPLVKGQNQTNIELLLL